jgi:hypothetical protein
MPKLYVLKLTERQLMGASDMLRYDGVYDIRCDKKEGICTLDATGYTPGRWRSFGVEPKLLFDHSVTQKEWEYKAAIATGFTQGLRFCQGRLVEEEFKKHGGTMLVEGNLPGV